MSGSTKKHLFGQPGRVSPQEAGRKGGKAKGTASRLKRMLVAQEGLGLWVLEHITATVNERVSKRPLMEAIRKMRRSAVRTAFADRLAT